MPGWTERTPWTGLLELPDLPDLLEQPSQTPRPAGLVWSGLVCWPFFFFLLTRLWPLQYSTATRLLDSTGVLPYFPRVPTFHHYHPRPPLVLQIPTIPSPRHSTRVSSPMSFPSRTYQAIPSHTKTSYSKLSQAIPSRSSAIIHTKPSIIPSHPIPYQPKSKSNPDASTVPCRARTHVSCSCHYYLLHCKK